MRVQATVAHMSEEQKLGVMLGSEGRRKNGRGSLSLTTLFLQLRYREVAADAEEVGEDTFLSAYKRDGHATLAAITDGFPSNLSVVGS
jgi:hypothetical protein